MGLFSERVSSELGYRVAIKLMWTHFTDGAIEAQRGNVSFLSIEQETEGPRDEVTCPRPYLCPREMDIQLFLQGYSLPSRAAHCSWERHHSYENSFRTPNVSKCGIMEFRASCFTM